MSLQAQPIFPILELTVQVVRAAFRKGNIYMQMRDLLGTFFTIVILTNAPYQTGSPTSPRPPRISHHQYQKLVTQR